jgi:hypothetical protein
VKQELLIIVAGIALGALVLAIARRRLLTVRYTVGWVLLAGVVIVVALLTPLIEPIANWFGMTATGVLLFMATGTLLLICIQLSITASGLTAQQRDLTEAIALLRERVDELEGRDPDAPRT